MYLYCILSVVVLEVLFLILFFVIYWYFLLFFLLIFVIVNCFLFIEKFILEELLFVFIGDLFLDYDIDGIGFLMVL